jgi:hypothetical protein
VEGYFRGRKERRLKNVFQENISYFDERGINEGMVEKICLSSDERLFRWKTQETPERIAPHGARLGKGWFFEKSPGMPKQKSPFGEIHRRGKPLGIFDLFLTANPGS